MTIKMQGRITLLVVSLVLSAPLLAADVVRSCGNGGISGGQDVDSDPLELMECRLWARAFCRAAENREFGFNEDDAAGEVSDYLRKRIATTGTNYRMNWSPLARQAANYAFRREDLHPGSLYYYAAYSCGMIKQSADMSDTERDAFALRYEQGAAECLQAHPPVGIGFPNGELRDCMRQMYSAAAGKD